MSLYAGKSNSKTGEVGGPSHSPTKKYSESKLMKLAIHLLFRNI